MSGSYHLNELATAALVCSAAMVMAIVAYNAYIHGTACTVMLPAYFTINCRLNIVYQLGYLYHVGVCYWV